MKAQKIIGKILDFWNKEKSIFKESFWIAFAEYFSQGVLLVLYYFVNKKYGTSSLGDFAFNFVVAQIITSGLMSPFSPLIRKYLSSNNFHKSDYFSTILQIKYWLFAIALFVFSIGYLIFFHTAHRLNFYFLLLPILTKGFDMLSETFYVTFQSCQKIMKFVVLKVSNSILNILILSLVILLTDKIELVYWALFLIAFLFFLFNLILQRRSVNLLLGDRVGMHNYKTIVLNDSWPLIINAFIFLLGSKANSLLVYKFLGNYSAGIFSSVMIVVNIFSGIASAIGISFYYKLNKIYISSREVFIQELNRIMKIIFQIGLLFFLLFALSIKIQLMVMNFREPHLFWMILSVGLGIPFIFILGTIGNLFIVINRQKLGMKISFFIMIFNILLYFIFVKVFLLPGAFISTVVSFIFQSIVYTYFLKMQVKKQIS